MIQISFVQWPRASKQQTSQPAETPRKNLEPKAALRTKASVDQQDVRPNRYLSGTVAFRQICKYHKSTELLIRTALSQRTVREISEERMQGVCLSAGALKAIQHCAEPFLEELFEEAQGCAIEVKLLTIYTKEIYIDSRLIRVGHLML